MAKTTLITCPRCEVAQEPGEFNRASDRSSGRNGWCKYCYKDWRLQRTYGITLEDYDRMMEEQGGVCKICRKPSTRPNRFPLNVDHCHKTGKVRGLLCIPCNRALGFIDNVKWRRAAVAYLKESRGE